MKILMGCLLAALMSCLWAGHPKFCFAQEPAKVKVVATFSILGDLVKNVGGDAIDLTVLVGVNGDAHTFEPTPQDGIQISKANVIFENGFNFEHWLNDLYEASQSKALRVVVTHKIVIPRYMEDEAGHEHHHHDAQDVDPHAWHNVIYAMGMVNSIKEAFISLDPARGAVYEANAASYLNELQALEDWIIGQVDTLEPLRRKMITSHDTFGYFADHYGFELAGAAIASATTEAAEPSAMEMTALIGKIKKAGVPVIFTENTSSPKLVQMLAVEAKVRVASPLYTDALGEEGSQGDTYIKMMRYNVTTITEGLKQ